MQKQRQRCGVIDAVQVDHREPINEAAGSDYQCMRTNRINQKLELREQIEGAGSSPNFIRVRVCEAAWWQVLTEVACFPD